MHDNFPYLFLLCMWENNEMGGGRTLKPVQHNIIITDPFSEVDNFTCGKIFIDLHKL